jgi:hypothetical protein
MLRKFIIEREVPGIGQQTPDTYCAIAQKSKNVLDGMGTGIQWVESFVSNDKIYCVYLSEGEEAIREHANRGGFPANRITEVRAMLDPTMAPA